MATVKQRKAFQKVLNGSTITKAMVDSDYAPTTASTTGKLTRSKGWEKLLQTYLPDKLLAEKHLALLNKEEVITKNNVTTGEIDVVPTGQIDVQAVTKGLDMAYKLKSHYPKDGQKGSKNLIVIISSESAQRFSVPNADI